MKQILNKTGAIIWFSAIVLAWLAFIAYAISWKVLVAVPAMLLFWWLTMQAVGAFLHNRNRGSAS